MRVTPSMMNNQFIRNLHVNNQRLNKYQDMTSTNKRINKPSDDPVGISSVMRYKSQTERNDQYLRNLTAIQGYLNATDSALSKINDVFQRARELAVQGANDTVPLDAKEAIAAEIDQLYDELVDLGNTQFGGVYIFNGYKTDSPPYTKANARNEDADGNTLQLAISDGVSFPYNTTGKEVFGLSTDGDNAFAILKDLAARLRADDAAGVDQLIGDIDTRMTKFQKVWADVGARQNRVDLIQNRLESANLNLAEMRSQTEDADMAEVITNLKMAEAVQRAALGVGARVLQPSLVDFLR